MIIPPIFGAIQSVRDGLEKRYIASYLALTVVGMGSWCFHMTLKYEMQLLDELPMIYSCCIFVYCMFECFKMKNSVNYHLLFILVLFSLIVTTVYLKVKEPIFHQREKEHKLEEGQRERERKFQAVCPERQAQFLGLNLITLRSSPELKPRVGRLNKCATQVMYGMLVFTLVLRSIYIVTWVYPWLRGLGYTSLGIFLLGFLLWNIDNIFCDSLRNFRKKMPPIIGVATQFHAWWHILTGLGSYLHILFSLYTRTLYLRYRPKVKFLFGIWPVILFEPLRKH
ncbi:alkaline ceramidase 3 isoform X2 [Vulpes vulpes]